MKTISRVLILLILCSFTACHSTKIVLQKDEIKDVLETDQGFYLYTENYETYYFLSPYHYRIVNDTLVGTGQVVIDKSMRSSEYVKIAIEDITKIEIEELDGTRTVIAVVAVGLIVGTVYFMLYLMASSISY